VGTRCGRGPSAARFMERAGVSFTEYPPLSVLVHAIVVALVWWAVFEAGAATSGAVPDKAPSYVPRAKNSLTFNKDIAPIVFRKCAPCHRTGGAGPFPLLSYADVHSRVKIIGDVVQRRYMPPWLPEPGYAHFANDPSLTSEQIGMIEQWITEGAQEGSAADLPPLPKWSEDWELGSPDLVLSSSTNYLLAAEGRDVYRNLVIPIPTTQPKYVRAVEFKPGNYRVVHHAFVQVDPTRQARSAVDTNQPAGFDGMSLPEGVTMPSGQMLGWQPGKRSLRSPDGLPWILEPNSDLVLQLHLHPTGKPEMVRPAVGFYFTQTPPTNTPFRVVLKRHLIDISPGVSNYVIENTFVLPVDVALLRIFPHCHYLGKRLEAYAIAADKSERTLLLIKNWDFDWQADYVYAEPILLPAGTTLGMRFTYDNSTNNVQNPNHPPRRVRFGPNSTDEMAELWLQVLARNPGDRQMLAKSVQTKLVQNAVEENNVVIQRDPLNAAAHGRLGTALYFLGQVEPAIEHLREAVRIKPDDDVSQLALGGIYLRQKRFAEAKVALNEVIRSNPKEFQAYGYLGLIYLQEPDLREATKYLGKALQLNPNDPVSRRYLEQIRDAVVPRRP
ncbi:MAG: tetratricopeptide repeat protein, partial [Verrucomicrobiales bacterium]|nr:tetratricopeptide repeat protein [Verrucomicrobiales bacterium]